MSSKDLCGWPSAGPSCGWQPDCRPQWEVRIVSADWNSDCLLKTPIAVLQLAPQLANACKVKVFALFQTQAGTECPRTQQACLEACVDALAQLRIPIPAFTKALCVTVRIPKRRKHKEGKKHKDRFVELQGFGVAPCDLTCRPLTVTVTPEWLPCGEDGCDRTFTVTVAPTDTNEQLSGKLELDWELHGLDLDGQCIDLAKDSIRETSFEITIPCDLQAYFLTVHVVSKKHDACCGQSVEQCYEGCAASVAACVECQDGALEVQVFPPWDPSNDQPVAYTVTVLDTTNGGIPLANQEVTYQIHLTTDDPSQCVLFADVTVTTNAQGQFVIPSGTENTLRKYLADETQVIGYFLTVTAHIDRCTCLEGCNSACASDRPPPSGSETAWGFDSEANLCFPDVLGACTNKWGWALGPYDQPIDTNAIGSQQTANLIAGAGQCDTNAGTLVGTVTATLSAINGNTLTFDYEYTITVPPWLFLIVHIDFWSGRIPPRRVDGEPNCNWAPGQFACSTTMPGATTIQGQCIRTFDTLANGWYFFPHAVVAQTILYNA